MVKFPAFLAFGADLIFRRPQGSDEIILGALALQEMLLVRRFLVRIAGETMMPSRLEIIGEVIEKTDGIPRGPLPSKTVVFGGDAEPLGFGRLDGLTAILKTPSRQTDRSCVRSKPSKWDAEGQIRRWRELMEALLKAEWRSCRDR